MTRKATAAVDALMPGLDFMNQLASAGSGSNWIAPTVDIDELERRIRELKTVQFWLEQNLQGIKASIQALEVQKMTLQTLQSMNLGMSEIAKAFTLSSEKPADTPNPGDARSAVVPKQTPQRDTDGNPDEANPAAAMADPLQWWGALTQQFQQIATQALQEAAAQTTPPGEAGKSAKAPAAAEKTAPSRSMRSRKAGTAATRRATSKK